VAFTAFPNYIVNMWEHIKELVSMFLTVHGVIVYGEYMRDLIINQGFSNRINLFMPNKKTMENFVITIIKEDCEIVTIYKGDIHEDEYYTSCIHIRKGDFDYMLVIHVSCDNTDMFLINDDMITDADHLYMDSSKMIKLSPLLCIEYDIVTEEEIDDKIDQIIVNICLKKLTIINHEATVVKRLMEDGWHCLFKNTTPFIRAPGEQCILCLEDLNGYAVGQKKQCCNAHYHHKCFMKVMSSQDRCPMCRTDF
jgi:hypothetical protein